MWSGHTTHFPNLDLYIRHYHFEPSMALNLGYIIKHKDWGLIGEMKDVLILWHHGLHDYSSSMGMLFCWYRGIDRDTHPDDNVIHLKDNS